MIVVLIYGIIQVDAGQHVEIVSLKPLKNLEGSLERGNMEVFSWMYGRLTYTKILCIVLHLIKNRYN